MYKTLKRKKPFILSKNGLSSEPDWAFLEPFLSDLRLIADLGKKQDSI